MLGVNRLADGQTKFHILPQLTTEGVECLQDRLRDQNESRWKENQWQIQAGKLKLRQKIE